MEENIYVYTGSSKFMTQNVRVDRWHYRNHLLYRNTWAKVANCATSQDRNMKGIFIDGVIDKRYVYYKCSKFHQLTVIDARES